MLTLGIETSCDETAASVVRDGRDILSTIIHSQVDVHKRFGGVVPEIAGRAHTERIVSVIEEALQQAGLHGRQDLDCIAVTHQPGLVGSLLIGLTAAKMLALAWDKPLVAVNHIDAHLYAGHMTAPDMEYPAVGLVASGGHTAVYHCPAVGDAQLLGGTIDDAAGECFDKVASILQLAYPGGPEIDRLAKQGNAHAISFPQSFVKEDAFRFSFSGLKTAVLYEAMGRAGPRDDALLTVLTEERRADLAASFQRAVVEVLVAKLMLAAKRYQAKSIILGGGVSCNSKLREDSASAAEKAGLRLIVPPPELCTDNAAMVAGLGCQLFQRGDIADPATLDALPTQRPVISRGTP